jgi:putative two-component system response regulator
MIKSDHLLGARLLIVDDQEVNLRILDLTLRREGFTTIRCVADPYEVLPAYASFQPDIILLDLLMPGMDGFAIIELLRRRIPAGVFLPILVLTADVSTETRRRALALGAKDFLTKPFDPIEVMLRILNLLETRFFYLQLQQQNEQLSLLVERGLRELDEQQAVAEAAPRSDTRYDAQAIQALVQALTQGK